MRPSVLECPAVTGSDAKCRTKRIMQNLIPVNVALVNVSTRNDCDGSDPVSW